MMKKFGVSMCLWIVLAALTTSIRAEAPEGPVTIASFGKAGGKGGVGEIGIIGVAAAIANAVYHATGRRFRSLPITIDQPV